MSWWVGLDREQLQAAITARLEGWKRERVGLLDTIGEQIRRDARPLKEPRRED